MLPLPEAFVQTAPPLTAAFHVTLVRDEGIVS
jgi:hypothetical protein